MKRNTTEVLRRGLHNVLANWPLIAIRIAESIFFLAVIVGSIIAAVVPIAVSAGLGNFDWKNADNPAEAVAQFVLQQWPMILYVLIIASVVLLLLVGVHAFVDGGSANVFILADRGANNVPAPDRRAFGTFSMQRWMEGGLGTWWRIFWIYNIAWGFGGLVMLVPLVAALAAMFAVSDSGARVAIGCGGIALSILVILPIAVFIALWTQKAIVVCVSRRTSANDSLREGWRAVREDFGRHAAVAFIVFVIAFGGGILISMLSAPMSFSQNHAPLSGLIFAPVQIASSLAQSIFSAAVGLWFLASYVALTEER